MKTLARNDNSQDMLKITIFFVLNRTEDTVVYGNQCGKTEVFYQQAVTPNIPGGLPTPADLMGIVSLKAKRRLERDHGIVML